MKKKSLDEEKKHNNMDSKKTLTCSKNAFWISLKKKIKTRRSIQNNLNTLKN
jgi:hypothetical protein